MYMKIHREGKAIVVALCDEDVIGKVFTEGDVILDLKNYASFYKGEKVDEDTASRALLSATSANIVGKRSVALAEKQGLIKRRDVKKIGGVPHVQIYRI
jgi:hypothetical protein